MESECTFEALPFLFPERQRASLLAWRQQAVERERRHAARRRQQLLDLQCHVAERLMQPRERQLTSRPKREDTPSYEPKTTPTIFTVIDKGGPKKNIEKTPCLESPPMGPPIPNYEAIKDKADKWLTINHNEGGQNPPSRPLGDVYVKVTALGRGFLTRRLLQSAKISNLIKTIRDGNEVLAGISEPASKQDRALCDRVHTQLQLARMTLFDILELPVAERMAYVAHSRLLRQQKMERQRVSVVKVVSRGRLSMATQKAIERRHKSLATIPPSKSHKLQDKSKLQLDRSGGESTPQVHPVPRPKVPSHPGYVAAQDRVKARQAKTAIPLRVSGQKTYPDRTAQSGQASKLGQPKLAGQAGRHRPQTQPLATHLYGKTAKKSKTHVQSLRK